MSTYPSPPSDSYSGSLQPILQPRRAVLGHQQTPRYSELVLGPAGSHRPYLRASQKPNEDLFVSLEQFVDEDTIHNAQSKESLRYIVIELYVL